MAGPPTTKTLLSPARTLSTQGSGGMGLIRQQSDATGVGGSGRRQSIGLRFDVYGNARSAESRPRASWFLLRRVIGKVPKLPSA